MNRSDVTATRRHFIKSSGLGLGSIALASLLEHDEASYSAKIIRPLSLKPSHFPAQPKSVVFLYMTGGPSHLDMLDHKPRLTDLGGNVAKKLIA